MHGKIILKFCVLGVVLVLNGYSVFGQPVFSEPVKLHRAINSPGEESFPLFFDNSLYFVRSFYAGNVGGVDGGHDIWRSERINDDQWTPPHNHFPLFNNKDNNAVIGISRDGNRMYLMNSYHRDEEKSLRVEVSLKKGSVWSIPQRLLIKEIYPEGRYSGFYMHPSERILLISMQGKNTLGGEDLYVCLADHLGKWSEPVHLGRTINTKGFEISPFLSDDARTLYFSSNGRPDSRGADIYFSTRLDNTWQKWSEPVRLPEGINSEGFDAYFFLSEIGEAFFVSNRNDDYTDIYSARIIETLAVNPESNMNEKEKDANGGLADAERNGTFSAEMTGKHLNRDGNMIGKTGNEVSAFDSKGSALVYFDFASAELSEEMKDMLKYIVLELQNKKDYRIELSGFADDLGPENYNRILSQKRAESVKQFLIEEGLNGQNIVPMGKGMVHIAEADQDEARRQKNRRVELVVLN